MLQCSYLDVAPGSLVTAQRLAVNVSVKLPMAAELLVEVVSGTLHFEPGALNGHPTTY